MPILSHPRRRDDAQQRDSFARGAYAVPLMLGVSALLGLCGCAYVPKTQFNAVETQARILNEQSKAQLAEISNLKSHNRKLEDQLLSAEKELAAAQTRSDTDRKRVTNFQVEREKVQEQVEGLVRGAKITGIVPVRDEDVERLAKQFPLLRFDSVTGAYKLDPELPFEAPAGPMGPSVPVGPCDPLGPPGPAGPGPVGTGGSRPPGPAQRAPGVPSAVVEVMHIVPSEQSRGRTGAPFSSQCAMRPSGRHVSCATGTSPGASTQNAETQRASVASTPAVEHTAAKAPQSPVVIPPSRHVSSVPPSRQPRA